MRLFELSWTRKIHFLLEGLDLYRTLPPDPASVRPDLLLAASPLPHLRALPRFG
jgi:hypothetical protein